MQLGIRPSACEVAIKSLESHREISVKAKDENDFNPWIKLV